MYVQGVSSITITVKVCSFILLVLLYDTLPDLKVLNSIIRYSEIIILEHVFVYFLHMLNKYGRGINKLLLYLKKT